MTNRIPRGRKKTKVIVTDIPAGDKHVLIYARVSSERQKNEGNGLESQIKRCTDFATTKGYIMDQAFRDSFTGAGDYLKRPAITEMFAYIDSHPHRNFVVIIDDTSRLARDVVAHKAIRLRLKLLGVEIECLTYVFEETPEGEFIETIFAARNEYDRKQNQRKVIAYQKARLEQGYRPFQALKGYTKKPHAIHRKIDTPNEIAHIIKEGLEGFASLRFPQKIDVVRFFQQKGALSAKQRPENATSVVDGLLREPFYAGFIEYPPWEVERRLGNHEPLISLETFEKNQRRLKGASTTVVRQDIRDEFELRGLVNCAECNNKLTASHAKGKSGKRHPYYRCYNRGCIVQGKSIPAQNIRSGFGELLKAISPSDEVVNLATSIFSDAWEEEKKNQSTSKVTLENRKTALETTISRLVERITKTDNESVIGEYEKEIETLSTELSETSTKIASEPDYTIPYRTSLEEVLATLKDPYSIWDKYTTTQKRRFFQFIFEGNLTYSQIDGYRTPKYTLPIMLFKEITSTSCVDVEMGVSKPRVNNHEQVLLHA